jgi:hypothetical protein
MHETTGIADQNESSEEKYKNFELTSNSIFQIVQNAPMKDTNNGILIDYCAPYEAQDDDTTATASCEEDSLKSIGAAKLASHPVNTNSGPPRVISKDQDQDINASFFVKLTCLFCSTKNAYHIGQILDWQEQKPVKEHSNYNLDWSVTIKRKTQTFNAGLSSRNSNNKLKEMLMTAP